MVRVVLFVSSFWATLTVGVPDSPPQLFCTGTVVTADNWTTVPLSTIEEYCTWE